MGQVVNRLIIPRYSGGLRLDVTCHGLAILQESGGMKKFLLTVLKGY